MATPLYAQVEATLRQILGTPIHDLAPTPRHTLHHLTWSGLALIARGWTSTPLTIPLPIHPTPPVIALPLENQSDRLLPDLVSDPQLVDHPLPVRLTAIVVHRLTIHPLARVAPTPRLVEHNLTAVSATTTVTTVTIVTIVTTVTTVTLL